MLRVHTSSQRKPLTHFNFIHFIFLAPSPGGPWWVFTTFSWPPRRRKLNVLKIKMFLEVSESRLADPLLGAGGAPPPRGARRARPPSRLSADRRGRSPYASVSPMQPNQSGLPVDLLILSGRQIPVGWAPVDRSAELLSRSEISTSSYCGTTVQIYCRLQNEGSIRAEPGGL